MKDTTAVRPARGTYRFRNYTIRPDERTEAEPIVSGMECKSCGERGQDGDGIGHATEWAVEHLKANPTHLEYREHITRSYHFEAGAWH
ncbi:hypothetical protein [Streptomyces aidingensis]|uniref:DUF7848 domain-containing protein n=1 Tax=Streptomyces aidingensis TaxID=910347 RepID=A0A1I1QVT7_9ACTN|nr:hypothetical protein [Streptomyces aidingensis]SFD26145.1 hypothetical protein SAMN05421773_11232 [Streptomyces aidingensis]